MAVLVRLGGIGVVAAVMFIAAYLVAEAAPLSRGPELGAPAAPLAREGAAPPLLAGVEPFAEALWSLDADGLLHLRALGEEGAASSRPVFELEEGEHLVGARLSPDQGSLVAATSAGRLAELRLAFEVDYGEQLERTHRLAEGSARWLVEDPGEPLLAFAHLADGDTVWAATLRGRNLELVRGSVRRNRMTGEETLRLKSTGTELEADATGLAVLESGSVLVAFANGSLRAWQPDRSLGVLEDRGSFPPGAPVLAVEALIGAGSALVARADGSLERWMLKTQESGAPLLGPGTPLPEPFPGLRRVVPSSRQRLFFALGDGELRIGQATAATYLGRIPVAADVVDVLVAPREDHLLLRHRDGRTELRELELGFPAVTSGTLFGKVLYEGAREPGWTWQSTGGTDAYEPKISFIPLIVGTLKGTFWALLPSIPLALLGALFTARFLRGRAREIVKPAIELLAGIPSVILGFVGALYLAPAIQDRMLAVFLLPFVLFGLTALLGLAWSRLSQRRRLVFHEGWAPFLLMGVYFVVAGAVLEAGPWLEQALLGDTLRNWAPDTLGLPFEQRNAAVVGLAMGFAVTPLIFTLAEDAFRNVPETLAEASLALGATPWQTSVRVIVPPALPGVVAAVMLGLGRAVGETMIVLMATGNTPITGMNVLQGFRALSANLAVELPEAPHGESLYRTLFLSALLLFGFTFLINTLAEVVRVRGRKAL